MLCIIICKRRIGFRKDVENFHLVIVVNLFISSSRELSIWKFKISKGADEYNFSFDRIRDNAV